MAGNDGTKKTPEKNGANEIAKNETVKKETPKTETEKKKTEKTAPKKPAPKKTAPKKAPEKKNTLAGLLGFGSSTAGTRTRMQTPSARSGGTSSGGADTPEDNAARLKKLAIKVILLAAALLAIIGFWQNRVDWSCANIMQCARDLPAMAGGGDGFPVTAGGGTSLQIDRLGNGIAVLTDTNFSVYNRSGMDAAVRAHYMSNPAMSTAGRYAALFDIGGKTARLETASATLSEIKTEGSIVAGGVSRMGHVVLAVNGSEYSSAMVSEVTVYDRDGTWTHKYHNSDFYVTTVALSDDGKYLAIGGIAAREGAMESTVLIQKVGKKEVIASFERSGIIMSLEFVKDGTLFAIGSSEVFIIDDYGKSSSVCPLEGELMAFDVDYDTGAAVYASRVSDASQGTLRVFDTNGQVRFLKDLPVCGEAVSLDNSGCCLLGRGELCGYRLDGEELGEWPAGATSSHVLLMGRDAYATDGVAVSHTHLFMTEEEKND